MEIQQIDESFGKKLYNLLTTMSDNQYVQCPCKVTAVNGEYVDVLPIINDDVTNQELYDVKIRRHESSKAYIYFKVHVGDRGVLRFFDRSIADYSVNGSEEYNQDDRMHDVNDGLFELGFIPDEEKYEHYPTEEDIEFELGLKDRKLTLSIDKEGKTNLQIGLDEEEEESKLTLEIDKDGKIELNTKDEITINVEKDVTMTVKGDVTSTIEGDFTGLIKGDSSATIQGNLTANINGISTITCPTNNITGNINVTGGIIATGDVVANGISLFRHKHTGVTVGTGKTGNPVMDN